MDQDRSQKTEDQINALADVMKTGTMQHARGMLNELNPAEIAHLLESLPHNERNIIWDLVDSEKEGEVLIQGEQRAIPAAGNVDHELPLYRPEPVFIETPGFCLAGKIFFQHKLLFGV